MVTLFPAPEPLPVLKRSPLQRFGVAVLAVAAALALRSVTDPWLSGRFPYGFVLLAVAFVAWYGGVWPAVAATLIGGAAVSYMFIELRQGLVLGSPEVVALLAYLATGLLLSVMSGWYRRDLHGAAKELLRVQQEVNSLRVQMEQQQNALERAARLEGVLMEERDELKQRLTVSEERIGVAEESARLCLFDWQQREGTMVLVGDPLPVFGITPEQWQGVTTLYELLHDGDRQRVQDSVAQAVAENSQLDLEFRVNVPGGGTQWVAAKGTTSYDLFGAPLRTIGIFQDITKKKITEQALVRNEKLAAAGRLAASIAHEINNPLAAVTNLLYILRDDRSLSQAGKQYLAMAEQELSRVGQIAKQTLGFYKESTSPVPVNVAELLDEVVALYARNMPSTVHIEKDYGKPCEIRAMRGEVHQVFANLISNALNAMGDSGSLRLVARPVQDNGRTGVTVQVADDGPGIPSEHLPSLFEPFFTTRPGVGTGLGLWVARELVEKHGGELRVESSTDEKTHGTRFEVFLPAGTEQVMNRSSAA